jgi:DtxR family Mn-dependent transcriptional regulator
MNSSRQTKSRDKGAKELSASLEDYLQVIFHLEQSNRVARAKDIADQMGVRRPSVTGALKILADRGLIHYSPYSSITLTSEGRALGVDFLHRHRILKEFFTSTLQLDCEHAELNACRIEHAIDSVAIERLVRFVEFLKSCPRTGAGWSQAFTLFCQDAVKASNCRECLKICLDEIEQVAPQGSRN